MWSSLTEAQYDGVLSKLIGLEGASFLPSTHMLTKKSQVWIDKIDAALRAAHPSAMAGVPKPKARVLREASPNAFIAPAPICYTATVKLNPGTPTAATTVDAAYLDSRNGELSSWPGEDLPCLDAGTAGAARLKSYALAFNAKSTGCKLTVTTTGTSASLAGNAACSIHADLEGAVQAKKVVLLQTADWVTIHTGIFKAMTEESFVAVVAHELGHYYRSHATAHESDFDFFYTLDRGNPDHRPTPEAWRRELGEAAVQGATLLGVGENYTRVEGQKLRSELFFAVGSLVRAAGAASGAVPECKAAADHIKTTAFSSAIAQFPFGSPSAAQTTAYKGFETKAFACLGKLRVTTSGTVGSTGTAWATFAELVQAPTWPSWLGNLPDSTVRALVELLQISAARLGDAPALNASYAAVLEAKSSAFAQQEASGLSSLREAHDSRLGQYTVEQEADENAIEWISDLGLEPKHAVEAMRSLGAGTSTTLGGLSLGQEDCDALWGADWLSASGEYQFVPVGDFSEVHHSTCYRMFNMEREVAAHDHSPANVALPAMGGSAWRALQDLADDLSPPVNGPQGPAFGRVSGKAKTVLSNAHALECAYALAK